MDEEDAAANSRTDEAAPAASRRDAPVVFIHSSYRTSSTWLFDKFRRHPDVWAYCEFFHELLATLRPGDVDYIDSRRWHSKHPPTPPYFLEFLPLLRPEGGIEGFDDAMALARFIPAGGPQGEIGDDEAAHVSRLIDLVRGMGKTPVLTETRSLGRLAGLKRRFGGFHVFLYRNLFHQWLSYCGQVEAGNMYFMNTIIWTIAKNDNDVFLSFLKSTYLPHHLWAGQEEATIPTDHALLGDPASLQSLFIAFLGLHIYAYLNAALSADLVIDVNRVARDWSHRSDIERTIAARTGISVDLSDARESVEYGEYEVGDVKRLEICLETVLSRALRSLDCGIEKERSRQFGQELIKETLNETAVCNLYTRALRTRLTTCRQALAELSSELADCRDTGGAALRERDRLERKRLRAPLRWIKRMLRGQGPPQ